MQTKVSKQTRSSILIIGLATLVISLFLVVSKSYFNYSELNLLVEKAIEDNLEYEVVIHNKLTNSYSFNIIDD